MIAGRSGSQPRVDRAPARRPGRRAPSVADVARAAGRRASSRAHDLGERRAPSRPGPARPSRWTGGASRRARRPRRRRPAVRVEQERLHALRADVDADHARPSGPHGDGFGRRLVGLARGEHAHRRARQLARLRRRQPERADDGSTTQTTITHGNQVYGASSARRSARRAAPIISAAPPSGSTPWRSQLKPPEPQEVARRREVHQHVDRQDPEGQQEAEVAVDVRAAGRVRRARRLTAPTISASACVNAPGHEHRARRRLPARVDVARAAAAAAPRGPSC